MKFVKKALGILLVAAMLASFAGCGSTPAIAITVDGKEYTTGEYLAYQSVIFQQAYYDGGLYYYEQQGTDVWGNGYTYKEEDVTLSEYIKKMTVDTIVRQKALENILAKDNIPYTEDSTKNAQAAIDSVTESGLLAMGISKEHYESMCKAFYRNEISLFLSRYDKGGSKEVKEEEIRKYFDDNYLSYKMISVEMMKDNTNPMDEAKQKEIKDNLEKYLKMYNDGKSFNEVIAQYNYDISTSSDKKLEKLTDKDTRKDIEVQAAGDEEFTNAIKSVKEGEAKLVTYKAGGQTLTAAIILRMDPEEGEGYKDSYKNSRQNILLSLKFDEFDKEIDAEAEKLTYEVNQRAYKMCDPKNFLG